MRTQAVILMTPGQLNLAEQRGGSYEGDAVEIPQNVSDVEGGELRNDDRDLSRSARRDRLVVEG
jgi:hypothetical protein